MIYRELNFAISQKNFAYFLSVLSFEKLFFSNLVCRKNRDNKSPIIDPARTILITSFADIVSAAQVLRIFTPMIDMTIFPIHLIGAQTLMLMKDEIPCIATIW